MVMMTSAPPKASLRAGSPGYQMSSQMVTPTLTPATRNTGDFAAGLEVAVLVEDAVVGEVLLVVDADQAAVVDDGGGVVDVLILVHEAYHQSDAAAGCRDLLQGAQVVVDEPRSQEQVLRRVAGDGQLGEAEQVDAQLAAALGILQDLGDVALQVADGGVDLSQTDPQDAHQLLSLCVLFLAPLSFPLEGRVKDGEAGLGGGRA